MSECSGPNCTHCNQIAERVKADIIAEKKEEKRRWQVKQKYLPKKKK